MKELPNTQLIFLVGFAHVTSLAYFENPSNCNYSIMRPFQVTWQKSCAFFISCISFLSAHSKMF